MGSSSAGLVRKLGPGILQVMLLSFNCEIFASFILRPFSRLEVEGFLLHQLHGTGRQNQPLYNDLSRPRA